MQVIVRKMQHYAELVKFEHTIFALPFALSSMLLASSGTWPSWQIWVWVIGAMVGGRTFAMGLNRIIDRQIDAKNPRTQNRSIPAGKIKLIEAWGLTLASLCLMSVSTLQLPSLCIQLLPVAVSILILYSYMKRFSGLSHLVLGLALASSAIGGWIAVTGTLTLPACLFGLAVLFWVAGFDIIYACQDVSFDRQYGLHSIPVSMGIKNGLNLSRVFHALAVVFLVGVGIIQPDIGILYWLAVVLTAVMLVYEQQLVSESDLSRVNEAFFNINGFISLSVFVLILLDKIV